MTGRTIIIIIFSALLNQICFSQLKGQITTGELTGEINTITTAVPFLMIAPDSRSGAMGDAGVATSPDVNSMHYNPAKYAFIEKDMGLSVSYTPWLRNLINDINLLYLPGYIRLGKGKNQVLSASLLYFSLGDITFTDIVGNTIGHYTPHEFAFDVAYSRLFSDKISGALAMRYIYSNLTGGAYVGGVESYPGKAIAADVSAYYENDIRISEKKAKTAFGINISNIGSKISYTEHADNDFIPINLKLGGALTVELDKYNSIAITADFNKLLVPTPPKYYLDSVDINGYPVIEFGKENNDISVPVGMLQSFYDAPGGYKEELHEITYSVGIEYWYSKQFALRAGYFYEHATKGNRKFATVGLGLKLNVFGLDFSYLMPTSGPNHPLANTLRFTLIFDFEGLKEQEKNSRN